MAQVFITKRDAIRDEKHKIKLDAMPCFELMELTCFCPEASNR